MKFKFEKEFEIIENKNKGIFKLAILENMLINIGIERNFISLIPSKPCIRL